MFPGVYHRLLCFFWKHPGALVNHVRTQIGIHADRALNADGLPGSPRTRLPELTHAHTTHLYTRTLSGDKPRCDTQKFGPDGARTRAGSSATIGASHRTFGPFAIIVFEAHLGR
jgi:hypothetical protein